MPAEAQLHIVATEKMGGKPLPVRVQVIPKEPPAATPATYGVADEINGRLHQEFVMNGDVTLPVPPGEHRVLVSRGYEWDLVDTTVTIAAGETKQIAAELTHSVDSTGAMCADFHIHSLHSADSSDPVGYKVKGAIADGLEIPVSSEHEWVVDFQPEIVTLAMTEWAFGVASSELTTFTWGHFGVVPLTPNGAVNNGAVEWIGKTPAETFAAAHAQPTRPVVIVNHPRSEGFAGYFSAARYDRTNNTGDAKCGAIGSRRLRSSTTPTSKAIVRTPSPIGSRSSTSGARWWRSAAPTATRCVRHRSAPRVRA